MSEEEGRLRQELERVKKENEQLKQSKSNRGLSMKVSQKGALSLYGLGRFPVTLYKQQWLRLLDETENIRQFIQNNDSDLKFKN